MNYTVLNYLLAALIALTVGAHISTRTDYSQPNWNFLPDMQYSPAYSAYARNPNFSNGRTLQSPPPGTLARDEMPLHYQATPEDALRADAELANPLAADDAAALARGAKVYQVFCNVCHGPTGAGDGPVARRGIPSLPVSVGNSVNMKDGQLFHILTFGRGAMASYASQLTPHDRWCVIKYLRTLQADAAQQAPPANPGDAAVINEVKN